MAKGMTGYEKWKKGIRLTKQEQINALCYECNGFETSGNDCLGEKTCPMYPYSPSAQKKGWKEGYSPLQQKEKRVCQS